MVKAPVPDASQTERGFEIKTAVLSTPYSFPEIVGLVLKLLFSIDRSWFPAMPYPRTATWALVILGETQKIRPRCRV
jgi:hypothetical protein